MREIGVGLRIKYKLKDVPTDEQGAEWAQLVLRLVQDGVEPDEAGKRAADQLFQIVPNLILKAEADTIESLLEQACKK